MSKIIAHRGVFNNKEIIENTMEAFSKAIEYNYPFELDVQLTKDNKLVVFHDDDLERLTGKKINLQNSNFEDIKNIKLLNSRSYIPLFSDVLKLNNDKLLIDIEVKKTKRIYDTISILMKELEGYDNYTIKSFDPRIVRYVRKNYPFVKAGILIDYKYENIFFEFLLHTKFILKYSMVRFISISSKLLENDKYKSIMMDYPTSIWTIKNKNEINYENDIVYICNNLPYTK